MYGAYFNFSSMPFVNAIDPARVYTSAPYLEAARTLREALDDGPSLLLLHGVCGVGKTTLLAALGHAASSDERFLWLPGDVRHADALVDVFCEALRMAPPERGRENRIALLHEVLRERDDDVRRTVFLLDEPMNLPPEVLADFSNQLSRTSSTRGSLKLLVASDREWQYRDRHDGGADNASLQAATASLSPMDRDDVHGYVIHKLDAVGHRGTRLFDDSAIDVVAEHSQGVARRVNILCGMALVVAYDRGEKRITAQTILEAADDLQFDDDALAPGAQPLTNDAVVAADDRPAPAPPPPEEIAMTNDGSDRKQSRGNEPTRVGDKLLAAYNARYAERDWLTIKIGFVLAFLVTLVALIAYMGLIASTPEEEVAAVNPAEQRLLAQLEQTNQARLRAEARAQAVGREAHARLLKLQQEHEAIRKRLEQEKVALEAKNGELLAGVEQAEERARAAMKLAAAAHEREAAADPVPVPAADPLPQQRQVTPPEAGAISTAGVSEQAATASVSEQAATASVSEQAATAGVSERAATASVSEQAATASVSEQAATASVSEQTGMDRSASSASEKTTVATSGATITSGTTVDESVPAAARTDTPESTAPATVLAPSVQTATIAVTPDSTVAKIVTADLREMKSPAPIARVEPASAPTDAGMVSPLPSLAAVEDKSTLAGRRAPETKVVTASVPESAPRRAVREAVPTGRYTVAPGDSLFSISRLHGVSIAELKRWNGFEGDRLQIGQVLILENRSTGTDPARGNPSGPTGIEAATRLVQAAAAGRPHTVLAALTAGTPVDATDADGKTALMHAAAANHVQVVTLLLDRGAQIDRRKSGSGDTALSYAAWNGHLAALMTLLDRGATVNTRNGLGRSALMHAAIKGHAACVRVLLDRNADVNARTRARRTPLSAAVWNGHVEVARMLLDAGAQVDMKTRNGWTPLLEAASSGNLAMVNLLLAHGADPSIKTREGITPEEAALQRGHADVAAVLSRGDTRATSG